MEIQEEQRYNLPGFGYMRVRLLPCARAVFQFLEQYQHVSRLTDIDQLGPIRDVLPGAHHTRYEYLMAQLALITELCELEGPLPSGMSLGRNQGSFGLVPTIDKVPTNGEILQVLALLGNIGHLPTTFSGERAFLKYLRDNANSRRALRSGLPAQDRTDFARALESFDVYRLNYFIALFLLNRYRRRDNGPAMVDFCQSLLRSFASRTPPEEESESVRALWRFYRSIRRLTYIALDSLYAPVPFSLDLASIFLSLDENLGELFVEGSASYDALTRLEGVMEDTVYLAPATLLNHARVSDRTLATLEASTEPWGVGAVWDLVRPDGEWASFRQAPDDQRQQTTMDAVVAARYPVGPEAATAILEDPLGWERESRSKVGLRSCRFGAEFNPPRQHLHVAASLSPGMSDDLAWRACLRVCKQLVDLDLEVRQVVDVSALDDLRNGRSMLRMLLSCALGSMRNYRFDASPLANASPFFRGYGSTKISKDVDGYLGKVPESSSFDADRRNEIEMLREALIDVPYRGCLVCFAGSTVVVEEGKTLAEFDGVAVLLSRETNDFTLLIVEAKNVSNGNTRAEAQLRDQFERLGIETSAFEIQHLGRKGAYARVRPL